MAEGPTASLTNQDLHVLRGTLDPIPVGVILFDPRGRSLVANRAARDLLGPVATLPLEAWPGTGCFVKPGGGETTWADLPPCCTLRDGEACEERELSFSGALGATQPLLVSSRAVLDPDGEVVQVACSLTLIADHSRDCEEDRRARQFAALGTLLARVAGPLNDALTAVRGYTDLAMARVTDSDPVRGILDEIGSAGERAVLLTRRLQAYSKREVPVPRVLDLDAWLAEHVTSLSAVLGDDIDLDVTPGADGAHTTVDPDLLLLILTDLLCNAREATSVGGSVSIVTTPLNVNHTGVSISEPIPSRPRVVISVTDTGGGIEDSVLRRMFEPFFTTKPGALGLGLSTVERLMRVQGGSVRVENHRGVGASVLLELPRSETPRLETVGVPEPPSDRITAKATVLLVEDEAMVRDLVHDILESDHLRVIEARSAADALHTLGLPDTPAPDLLVSDVVLRGAMGPRLASCLRARYPELPVLLMSGCSDPELLAGPLADDSIAFLPKPFAPAELLAQVRSLLAASRARAAKETRPTPHPSSEASVPSQ